MHVPKPARHGADGLLYLMPLPPRAEGRLENRGHRVSYETAAFLVREILVPSLLFAESIEIHVRIIFSVELARALCP